VTAGPRSEPTLAVRVDVDDRQDVAADLDHLADLLASTLGSQCGQSNPSLSAAEVGLSLVETAEMATLNEQHMGKAGPTDVLAFPIDGVEAMGVPDGQPAMLGDVVICPAVAAQATQPLQDELALLVVHGALHLLGHDHAEPGETVTMKALEVEMLDRFHR